MKPHPSYLTLYGHLDEPCKRLAHFKSMVRLSDDQSKGRDGEFRTGRGKDSAHGCCVDGKALTYGEPEPDGVVALASLLLMSFRNATTAGGRLTITPMMAMTASIDKVIPSPGFSQWLGGI